LKFQSLKEEAQVQLKKVHIRGFKSVRDSNAFEVGDITCLVGKNEAGKTAVLDALYRLNPIVSSDGKYDVTEHYPRADVEDYRVAVQEQKRAPAVVAEVVFVLEPEDLEPIIATFGQHCVSHEAQVILWKTYDNNTQHAFEADDVAAIKFILNNCPFSHESLEQLGAPATFESLVAILPSVGQTAAANEVLAIATAVQKSGNVAEYIYKTYIEPSLPKFLYFDEYYQMDGRANIEALQKRVTDKQLLKSDHPLLGLISLARLNLAELANPSRTRELKNRLEGASNHLTRRIINYWSQNRYLDLRFDVRQARPEDPEGMTTGTNIWGDVYDSKHKVTTEMATRSRGFIWFFSFLAWYSHIQNKKQKVILLLDEPGLSLHAKAQEDLLRYFEAELKGNHQVIYTTHSPFLVDPAHFDRVRIVQDLSIETDQKLAPEQEVTKVLSDILGATKDSLFPLQSALGYELHQTLFIGPDNVVVEGASDLLYLQTISALLQEQGKHGLDSRWTITPVGGSTNVPTFVGLIGARSALNVAVLVDYQKSDKQTLENLYKQKLIRKDNLLTFADFIGTTEADIEDMFEGDFYLTLINDTYAKNLPTPLRASDITSRHPRILMRLKEYFALKPMTGNVVFNHFFPARHFSLNVDAYAARISFLTFDRFDEAFVRLNTLLK
jgi:predicted ATP-dependent endonuclease of OLD family